MVRSVQLRCRGLTVVVPDMARSAATILCLGAHHILMGPGGDLGPIGPQMLFPGGDGKPAVASPAVASAKEVVAAVAEAEERIKVNPDSFPLFLPAPAVPSRCSPRCCPMPPCSWSSRPGLRCRAPGR
ncbi:hypothetical protein [Propionibacterium acidifaciens]|uniref:hypothetical protein n=1 Tax=Propionibacterium acidifaciens TaxID=556499 RepID=UPI0036F29397